MASPAKTKKKKAESCVSVSAPAELLRAFETKQRETNPEYNFSRVMRELARKDMEQQQPTQTV